jgi:uncharacterized protein
MNEPDFSTRKYFPGTSDNPFDSLIHRFEKIEIFPFLVFALILLLLALIPDPANWGLVLAHWAFFLGDWALLAYLPVFNKSFGPAKPPVLILAFLRVIFNLLPIPVSLIFQSLGTLLVIYAFWIEPHHLKLTRQSLETKKIDPGVTLRILHLADLHLEKITNRESQLTQYIQNLKPDLIFFSGDFLNLSFRKDPIAWQTVRSLLVEWQKTCPVYLVTGSPAVDLPEIIPNLLDNLPVHRLDNELVTIKIKGQEINLYGVTCTHKPFEDGPQLMKLISADHDRFSVLLYHTPDLAPQVMHTGIDLQLSGHTHGGQVRLPLLGALFTGSLYGKRFEKGRQQIGGLTLYISRGMGMEGASAPRVRFLCPPEIILWEIANP